MVLCAVMEVTYGKGDTEMRPIIAGHLSLQRNLRLKYLEKYSVESQHFENSTQ